MRTETELRNRRLLEALDYIDGKYIDEALNCIYAPPRNRGYVKDPRTNLRILKQTLLAAACILLISALIPTVTLILEKAGIIAPGGITITTDPDEDLYQNYVLTLDELQRINIIWEKYEGEKFADTPDEACARWEYRGKYGDCIILRAKKENTNSSEYSIIAGNYRFSCDGGTYYVCRDFDVCTLLYAYEYGLINDLQVQKLNEYHVELEGYDSGGYVDEREYICAETVPVAMPFEAISDVIHTYFKQLTELEINMDPENHRIHINDLIYYIRCPAKFGEYYVVMIDWLNPDGGKEEYDLYLSENGSLSGTMIGSTPYILQDGELIDMTSAFKKGIITLAQYAQLVDFLNNESHLYPTKVFDPDSTPHDLALNSLVVTVMPYARNDTYTAETFSEIGCTGAEQITFDAEMIMYRLTFPQKTEDELLAAYLKLSMRKDIYTVRLNPAKVHVNSSLELTEEEREAFVKAYYNIENHEFLKDMIFCVWKRDTFYAIRTAEKQIQVISEETVCGYYFLYGTSNPVIIFTNNECYSLTEAYNMGIIDESDIKIIHENYNHPGGKGV